MPDQIGSIAQHILVGIRDVTGADALERLQAFPEVAAFLRCADGDCFTAASAFQRRLECEFTTAAGRGLIFRAGESAVQAMVRQHTTELGFNAYAFRFLPWRQRLRTGLERIAAYCERWFGSRICVHGDQARITWEVERCAWCFERQAEMPICDFYRGFISGFLGFASGGRSFQVHEICCAAAGGSGCSFEIDCRPVE